jgi:hypothetical protein
MMIVLLVVNSINPGFELRNNSLNRLNIRICTFMKRVYSIVVFLICDAAFLVRRKVFVIISRKV